LVRVSKLFIDYAKLGFLMLRFFIFLLLPLIVYAAKVQTYKIQNGQTYLSFLEKQKLPLKKLYYDLDNDDQILTQEIRAGVNYKISQDISGAIQQVLIPLNEELQIHIYKQNDDYEFEIIPVISITKTEAFTIEVQNSPHYDIYKTTGSTRLATIFVTAFQNSLNFKRDLRKGDKIVMLYEQKYRLGKPFSMPILKSAMVEMRKKQHFIYLYDDNGYYNSKGHKVEGFLLSRPVRGARISSYFSKRRFHPVLKRWKAHLGIDYAARSGTPVRAAGSGRVSYATWMGSYGKLVKLRHDDGYETRYAHLKSIKRGMYKGKKVKKGDVIGYVGTTGRSTGPHLHFELRKHGRAINPLRVVQVTTKKLQGKEKRAFLKLKENYDQSINLHLENNTKFEKLPKMKNECYFYNEGFCA
jgi:murein DD-endopeptidase MepM/ murein hydrolase activator NlpD